MYIVHCTTYSERCTMYIIQSTYHCTTYSVRCKLYTVRRTLYVRRTVINVYLWNSSIIYVYVFRIQYHHCTVNFHEYSKYIYIYNNAGYALSLSNACAGPGYLIPLRNPIWRLTFTPCTPIYMKGVLPKQQCIVCTSTITHGGLW